MGFKIKLFLFARLLILAGYIWYFKPTLDMTAIIFTGAVLFIFLIDWYLDDFRRQHSFKTKFFLFAILVALIFYIWYFDVPFSQDVMVYSILVILMFITGIKLSLMKPHSSMVRSGRQESYA